ncbi:MAG: hypothetical protein V7K14_22925 [Nostoc sp.]
MKTFTAIVERDPDTKFYVGYVPGFGERILKTKPWMSCKKICVK